MRKQLLALLSMVGLAGSTVPAQAQILKGSKEDSTKKASTVKNAKSKQETKAAAVQATDKHKKGAAEAEAAKTAGHIKMNKTEAGAAAAKADTKIKIDKNAAAKNDTNKKMDQASPK